MKYTFLITLLVVTSLFSLAQEDSAKIFFSKGDTAFLEKKYLLAERNYVKGLKYDSTNDAIISNLANCYLEMRKYNFAIPLIQKVYNKKQDNESLIQLAVLYFNTKDWANAITYNQLCVDKKIGTRNNYRIAKAMVEQEDYVPAAKFLKEASIEEPTNAEVPYVMANIWLEMQNMEKAVEMYQIALSLDSTQGFWHYELANIYQQLDSLSQATVQYELALARGVKNDLDIQRNLGICYISTKQYEKGKAILAKVIAKKSKDKTLFEDIGYAFYNNSKYDEAIEYWDEILKIDQNDARSLYMIGIAYRKKGDDDKGNRLCDAAIAMDPKLGALRKQMQLPIGAGL